MSAGPTVMAPVVCVLLPNWVVAPAAATPKTADEELVTVVKMTLLLLIVKVPVPVDVIDVLPLAPADLEMVSADVVPPDAYNAKAQLCEADPKRLTDSSPGTTTPWFTGDDTTIGVVPIVMAEVLMMVTSDPDAVVVELGLHTAVMPRSAALELAHVGLVHAPAEASQKPLLAEPAPPCTATKIKSPATGRYPSTLVKPVKLGAVIMIMSTVMRLVAASLLKPSTDNNPDDVTVATPTGADCGRVHLICKTVADWATPTGTLRVPAVLAI